MGIHTSFKLMYNPDDILSRIGRIFVNTQKTCTFVIPDRNLHELMEQEEQEKKLQKLQK